MQKTDLYIYGTVLNNAKWVRDSINSIKPLNPKAMIFVDGMSTDGTYEILQELGVKVIRTGKLESRGKSRQIALNEVFKIAKPDDFVMYIDLDTIYKEKFIDYVKNFINNPPERTIGIVGLSRVKDNYNVEWRDLNYGEDWERLAHFKSLGYNVEFVKEGDDSYWSNAPEVGESMFARERRYNSKIRLIKNMIDVERGIAFSFADFISQSKLKKRILYFPIYLLTYLIARVKGLYKYSDVNNKAYVKGV